MPRCRQYTTMKPCSLRSLRYSMMYCIRANAAHETTKVQSKKVTHQVRKKPREKTKTSWLAFRCCPFAHISHPHLANVSGFQVSTSPSVQYVDGDKDEKEAKKCREGLGNNGPFRLC